MTKDEVKSLVGFEIVAYSGDARSVHCYQLLKETACG